MLQAENFVTTELQDKNSQSRDLFCLALCIHLQFCHEALIFQLPMKLDCLADLRLHPSMVMNH